MGGAKGAGERGNDLVGSAIQKGLEIMMRDHPRFREAGKYIASHIDPQRVEEKVEWLYGEIARHEENQGKPYTDEQKAQVMFNNLANYASSGELLDDHAREVLFRESLHEDSDKPQRRGKTLDGEKSLDKTLTAFKDLYHLMASGDYAQRMPKLAQAVNTVYDMGFLDSAVEVLRGYDLLDDEGYELLKGQIHHKLKKAGRDTAEHIHHYSGIEEKVAASILGVLGLGAIISSATGITSNVIGNSLFDPKLGGIALGILLLSISSLILIKMRKLKKIGKKSR